MFSLPYSFILKMKLSSLNPMIKFSGNGLLLYFLVYYEVVDKVDNRDKVITFKDGLSVLMISFL